MPSLTVAIWDAAGTELAQVELPDDVPAQRLAIALAERLQLPARDAVGQPLRYVLNHQSRPRQLLPDQTLAEAGVAPGDTLRLLPELPAR
jgi:uncharacterized ubiquitin-like protein YukD